MIIGNDPKKRQEAANVKYDICICGTGPAGMTLARKLANQGWQVALMEGGGIEFDNQSQQLYQGEVLGEHYSLTESRLRFLGGASNHWGGETRPLDPRDFSPLAHHELNGWPIRKHDIDKYAAETDDILDLQQGASKNSVFSHPKTHLHPPQPSFRFSMPPTRFGIKYQKVINESQNIHLFLNANIVDIVLDGTHSKVISFVFRSDSKSTQLSINARYFVLCCGGLENPRVLLQANKQLPLGIGNKHDLVGRYFCEHITVPIGTAVMRSDITQSEFVLCSEQFMQEKKCLSFLVEFGANMITQNETFYDRLKNALISQSLTTNDSNVFAITQQACLPENRVTLSDESDALGLRKIALNWQASELDKHTIRTAAIEAATWLAKTDIGRMKVAPYILDGQAKIPIGYMNHHMCTTRMGKDPQTGVVDRNCRVFGLDNLYIGGSSVFASCGVSNPTYSIIQLTLRLNDHLNSRLSMKS